MASARLLSLRSGHASLHYKEPNPEFQLYLYPYYCPPLNTFPFPKEHAPHALNLSSLDTLGYSSCFQSVLCVPSATPALHALKLPTAHLPHLQWLSWLSCRHLFLFSIGMSPSGPAASCTSQIQVIPHCFGPDIHSPPSFPHEFTSSLRQRVCRSLHSSVFKA